MVEEATKQETEGSYSKAPDFFRKLFQNFPNSDSYSDQKKKKTHLKTRWKCEILLTFSLDLFE